jgi:hypothetical protein
VVRGQDTDATRTRKEDLKKLGGKYNPYLRKAVGEGREPGWIFPSKDKKKIHAYVNQVNNNFDKMPKNNLQIINQINRRCHSLEVYKKKSLNVTIDPTPIDRQCCGDRKEPPVQDQPLIKKHKLSFVAIKKPSRYVNWWLYSLALTATLIIILYTLCTE